MSLVENPASLPFTPQQSAAINGRGNLLVVAGAGTGKTRTLVARCLRLISEGASLENMLLVTFTEAAAAEMRARIRQELRALHEAQPADDHVAQQLALLDHARISTLHGFCLQLAREHFHALNLDPQFTVLDEHQTRPLMRATLDALFEKHYTGSGPASVAVQSLVRTVGRGSDFRLRRLIIKLHEYSQSLPDPVAWLQEQYARFNNVEPIEWRQWFAEAVSAWAREWTESLGTVAGRTRATGLCAEALQALPPSATPAQAAAALRCVVAADIDDNWTYGTKGAVRDPLKAFFADAKFLASLLPADDGSDPLAQDWEWTRGHMLTLISLTREFSAAFARAKNELGGVDFADLEQGALRLLRDPAVADQWRRRLEHLFVDEYQDINRAQDTIITALSRQEELETKNPKLETFMGNRFLVGDVKQSIYRFRLANPKIFSNYESRWSRPDADGQRIPLTENFRSRAGLLEFINPLFAALMRRDVGGVDYEPLQFGAADRRLALAATDEPSVELHVIARANDEKIAEDAVEENESRPPVVELLAIEREARLTARRLRELRESGHPVWDERERAFRPVRWSDMAVLLRSPGGRAEAFAMEFSRAGVPLIAARDGFFQSLEVSDLLSLLRLLDNPLQDLPLLAVLRSPLVGLSLNDLARVRAASSAKPFWTALLVFHREARPAPATAPPAATAPAHNGKRTRGRGAAADDRQGSLFNAIVPANRSGAETAVEEKPHTSAWAKADRFIRQFHRWRELVRHTSVSQCLETALAETDYEAFLAVDDRGEERLGNVRRLLDLARQFDPYQRQGLYRFLRFVEAQEEDEIDLAPATPASADAVRLMSIHRSKGLEFPVVAVAGLGTRFNEQDLSDDILLSESRGLCPKVTPPDAEQSYPGLPHWLARRDEYRELRGEELRLLYVALTRARDRLLLVGTTTRKAADAAWQAEPPAPIRTSHVLSSRSYLDWLLTWLPHATADENWRSDRLGENRLLRWHIQDPTQPIFADETRPPVVATPSTEPGSESVEELKARLAWKYPFEPATSEIAKTSVSTLRRAREEAGSEAQPWFRFKSGRGASRRGPGLSAAEIGSAHHLFLQHARLEQLANPDGLRSEADRLRTSGVLTEPQAAALDLEKLSAFWRSTLGADVLGQKAAVQREIPFTARFSPGDLAAAGLPSHLPPDEFVIVQGMVDLAVILPREIWVIDFKTDDVEKKEVAARTALYEPQLKLYALALARIYGRPITKCALYFLACGETIEVAAT
jgi:ATP-dependent helicase/nuclease subunit A